MQSEDGYSYLNFDGTNALKGTTSDYSGKQDITIILVGEYTGDDPITDSYGDINTALFWTESGGWGSMSLAPYKNQVMMRFGLGEANGDGTQGGAAGVSRYTRPAAVEKITVTTAVKNGSTHSLNINGEEVLSESGKNLTASGIGTDLYIGMGISAGANRYFSGKISEVLVYDRVLTDEETVQINNYLFRKYSILENNDTQTDVNPIVSAVASPVSVPKGTVAEKLVLPFSIDVTLEEEFSNVTQPTPSKQTKVPVIWDTSTFDPDKVGEAQTIYGDLNITLGKSTKSEETKTTLPVGNPNNVRAEIQITVREVERELYVSPTASSGGDGSKEAPFSSIQAARDAIRNNGWNDNMTGDILVWLAGGVYSVTEPITFDVEDSGSNGYSIIYQAIPGEVPNINGGKQVTDWKQWEENSEIYVADLSRDTKLRNLFVNGKEAIMTSATVKSCGPYGSVTVSGDEEWALDGGTEVAGVLLNWDEIGFTVDRPEDLTNPGDIEIRQQKTWNVVTIGLEEIKSVTPGDDGGAPLQKAVNINTDSSKETTNRNMLNNIAAKYASRQAQGDTAFVLQQPYGAIAACLAWQCNFEPYFGYVDFWGNAVENTDYTTFVIQNSLELLKNPGEFYFDKTAGKLYYYPAEDVDIYSAEIVAPLSEGLIRIEGSSTTDRVENLQFSGIKFTYDDKGLEVVEGSEGFASVQNMAAYTKYVSNGDWHYWKYNNTDIPKGSVNVENASGIVFTGNVFTTLSSSSCISYMNDVVDSSIVGNVFMFTSGNSATIGHPQHIHIDRNTEPAELADSNKYAEGVEGICKNIMVSDNYIENVCTMFTQADALTAFFVENVEFSYNRITNVPYSAINMGWGWQNQDSRTNYSGTHWPEYPSETARKNTIVYNDINNANQVLVRDGGALYTLGQQEDSIMAYNNVHGTRSVYTDEGTAFYEMFYNDIDSYNPNHSYSILLYGNDSNNAGHSYYTHRNADNSYSEIRVSALSGGVLDVPENIAAGAGIKSGWLSDIEVLKKQVAVYGGKYAKVPSDLKKAITIDFEENAIGTVTEADEQIGSFMDGGISIAEEGNGKVLKLQSTDGTYQHNGFYLKNVEYNNAVIEMDMKFNADMVFAHEWEAISVHGFASTAGGEEQLSQNESLFAGSYFDQSNMQTYHSNIGVAGQHTNGQQVSMPIEKGTWYHVKIMVLNGEYYVKVWNKSQEEPLEWQLWQSIPDEVGEYGTLRVASYKQEVAANIEVSFDNIVVYKPVYTIHYNENGGENAPESQTKMSGEDAILSDMVLVREGYEFQGWNTAADGSGESYNAGSIYNKDRTVTLYAQWNRVKSELPRILADFNFDADSEYFDGGYAKAAGTYTLVDYKDGKALKLDGNGQFLTLTTKDGSSLLTGLDELTVSFQFNPESSATNWGFFAAPNENEQKYESEKYIGIFDNNGAIGAERYYSNSQARPANPSTSAGYGSWYHVTVVFTETETILYLNGEEAAREASIVDISDLLGDNSVAYIGKSTWLSSGEYYKGLIDNYKIYSKALTPEAIKEEADKYIDRTALEAAIADAEKITDKDAYTPKTWEAFETALAAAKEVLADKEASQTEINEAASALTSAQKNLTAKADMSALEKLVADAKAINTTDKDEELVADLLKEIEDAEKVLANPDARQAAVDSAVKQLQDAIDAINEEPTPTPDPLPYVDVEETDWFYDAVAYTYYAEVMTGMDPTHFGPYNQLSRAQFALILYRIEGEPEFETEKSFADIAGDEWYGPAVLWAAEAGIVSGYENGCFGPVDNITREQMAVMMYRYANYLEKDTANEGDFSDFLDAESVSEFAVDAMKWATAKQIITGKEEGTIIDPQGNTARAEAAAIIQRFMK